MGIRETPKVDEAALFGEIAFDFRDPLDAVREAVSNAFDASATEIHITARVGKHKGDDELILEFEDNGEGMKLRSEEPGVPTIAAFFNLGTSTRRDDPGKIGQKGHGTKTYFNSRQIEITTWRDSEKIFAFMDEPKSYLSNHEIPGYEHDLSHNDEEKRGTKIIVHGYNRDRTSGFDQDQLQDFIYWFTKFGSIELQLDKTDKQDVTLYLQGVDRDKADQLPFGHRFPQKEEHNFKKLKEKDPASPTKHFVKKWSGIGVPVRGYPHIKLDILFILKVTRLKTTRE